MTRYLLVFFLFGQSAFAQQPLTLTKSQMYADFDTLAETIIRVSPHIPVKKDLWQYDAAAAIREKRTAIDTISSDLSFFILLQRVLNANMDMHTSTNGKQTGWADIQMNRYASARNKFKFSVGNSYIDGKYIITTPFVIAGDTVPIGAEITQFDNQPVDDYVATHLDSRSGFKYDPEHKKFYFTGFFKNLETIFSDTLCIGFTNPNGAAKQYKIPATAFTNYLNANSESGHDTTRVEYWSREKVLFIRVTAMREAFIPFLKAEIGKYRDRAAGLAKIIIDFRGNPGGSDTTWTSLYAELISQPLSFQQKIDDLNQPAITDQWYAERGYTAARRRKDNNPLLKNYSFYTVTDKVQTIDPSPTSIRFGGRIYILTEDHFSAAGSAISVANSSMTDNLVTVGRKTGYFLGIGFSPVNFRLPFSELAYRVAPSIEVTHATRLTDLMQDKIQIEIPYDVSDYINRFNYKGDISSKAFLLQYDPFVKKVMSL